MMVCGMPVFWVFRAFKRGRFQNGLARPDLTLIWTEREANGFGLVWVFHTVSQVCRRCGRGDLLYFALLCLALPCLKVLW
jgi:hypothetical protein